MEDDDREKIRSNLGRLVLRTQWNEKLETCLLTKGVFKPKMIQLIKVKEMAKLTFKQSKIDGFCFLPIKFLIDIDNLKE